MMNSDLLLPVAVAIGWYAVGLFGACQYLAYECIRSPWGSYERKQRDVRFLVLVSLFGPVSLLANLFCSILGSHVILTWPVLPGSRRYWKLLMVE